jgi:hypothetical protein
VLACGGLRLVPREDHYGNRSHDRKREDALHQSTHSVSPKKEVEV